MPNEPRALVRLPPDAINEDDYQAFCAALSASARGRAFLADYTRRNRNADTEVLLAALDRLDARLRAGGSAVERLRDELRMLLIAIRVARPSIDAAAAPAKLSNLTSLLALLERRIEAMAEPAPEQADSAHELNAQTIPPELPDAARSHLVVVPPVEEPELPIPTPSCAQPPTVMLVRPIDIIPEVMLFERAPPEPVVVEEKAAPPAPVQNIEAAPPEPKPAPPAESPLAPLMALSEDERIALFT
jgi:hypothetical protein